MEYTITHDKEINACIIRFTGKLQRPDGSKKLLNTALEAGNKHQCFRFLFDMREAEIIADSLMDSFEVVQNPLEIGYNLSYPVAAVYSCNMGDQRFIETVAHNRGARMFRVFDNIEKARTWLGSTIQI